MAPSLHVIILAIGAALPGVVCTIVPLHIYLRYFVYMYRQYLVGGFNAGTHAKNGIGMRTRLDPVGDVPCRTIAIPFLSPPSCEGQLLTGAYTVGVLWKQR